MTEMLEDAAIRVRVNIIWERVFTASNRIIVDAHVHGFAGMERVPDPNIHQILSTLSAFSTLMDQIMAHEIYCTLDPEEARLILNAKNQLDLMQRLAIALKLNDEVAFEEAFEQLERQAVF